MEDYSKIRTASLTPNLSAVNIKKMVKNLIKTFNEFTILNRVEFNVSISSQLNGNLLCDHERMCRVLLSILENAAFEARAGSVIEIALQKKPLSIKEIDQERNASNIDILDFSMLIVCSVNYEHHAQAPRIELADLNM